MRLRLTGIAAVLPVLLVAGCGSSSSNGGTTPAADGGHTSGGGSTGTDSGAGATGGTSDGGGTAGLACGVADTGEGADLHGYRPFPAGHPLNTPIDTLALSTHSADWIANCGASHLQTDLSMPYNVAPASTPTVTATALMYNGTPLDNPWRIPAEATIEGGEYTASSGDHHCLVLSLADCTIAEVYQLQWNAARTTFSGVSGTIWDTSGNGSATSSGSDAAGLPILPTIIRYDELVTRGAIDHALRFTCSTSSKAFIAPARAAAGSTSDLSYAPMGARVRLKSTFDVTGGTKMFSPRVVALLKAIQTYGLILADNGTGFYITGSSDAKLAAAWTDDDNDAVKSVTSDNLEAVDSGTIQTMD